MTAEDGTSWAGEGVFVASLIWFISYSSPFLKWDINRFPGQYSVKGEDNDVCSTVGQQRLRTAHTL